MNLLRHRLHLATLLLQHTNNVFDARQKLELAVPPPPPPPPTCSPTRPPACHTGNAAQSQAEQPTHLFALQLHTAPLTPGCSGPQYLSNEVWTDCRQSAGLRTASVPWNVCYCWSVWR